MPRGSHHPPVAAREGIMRVYKFALERCSIRTGAVVETMDYYVEARKDTTAVDEAYKEVCRLSNAGPAWMIAESGYVETH